MIPISPTRARYITAAGEIPVTALAINPGPQPKTTNQERRARYVLAVDADGFAIVLDAEQVSLDGLAPGDSE